MAVQQSTPNGSRTHASDSHGLLSPPPAKGHPSSVKHRKATIVSYGQAAEGIAIDDGVWQQIAALAGELEVELP